VSTLPRLERCLLLVSALSMLAPVARARDEVFPVESSIVPPRVVVGKEPVYPTGASGDVTVTLIVVVDASGKVASAAPLEVHEPFSSLAVSTVSGWQFEPARRENRAVAARIRVEVVFRKSAFEAASGDIEQYEADVDSVPTSEPPPEVADERSEAPEMVEVLVHGDFREPARTASLSRSEVRQLPGAFGDPFRAIEVLPGVTPIASGLPFFFVRGAPPGNVGYFVRDVRMPLLFHVGAGPSVIHPALIGSVDLYPGAYPARFGRFTGGIVQATLAPEENKIRGEYNLRLFDAGAFVETPFDDGRGALAVAGRYSFSGLLLSMFSDNRIEYWDYQARGVYSLDASNRLEAFVFGASDFVGEKTASGVDPLFDTRFHRVELVHETKVEPRGKLRTSFVGGVDRSSVPRYGEASDRLLQARTELDLELESDVALRAGSDLSLDRYDVSVDSSTLSPSAAEIARAFSGRNDLAFGIYAALPLRPSRGFEVTPGLRVDLYGSDGVAAVGIDPRLQLRTSVTKNVALLVALGIAHQPPSFTVPMPGVQPGGLKGGLQEAVQESLGVEVQLDDVTQLSVAAFYDAFFRMSDSLGALGPTSVGCPAGDFAGGSIGGDPSGSPSEDSANCGPYLEPGLIGPDLSGGRGHAADTIEGQRAARAFEVRTLGASYGLELFLKRRFTERWGGLLSYTLSRSTRSHGPSKYLSTFDRTHVLNTASSYDLGKGFRAGARIIFYSGLPAAADTHQPSRLPAFFRLDWRVEKRWRLGPRSFIALVAEWLNATLSKEALSTRCTLSGCEAETIGPITIPSLGLEGGF
jgi:hypothetical protein